MKLFKGTIVVLFVVLGLVVQTANPASAHPRIRPGAAVVQISTPPIGYPVLTPPGPLGGVFSVASTTACAGASVDLDGFTGVSTTCTITGNGVFGAGLFGGPQCGQSSGSVNGTVAGVGPTLTYSGTFDTAGSAVVIRGSVNGGVGTFVFVGDAIPVITVGGPSCLNGQQTQFIVAGVFDALEL